MQYSSLFRLFTSCLRRYVKVSLKSTKFVFGYVLQSKEIFIKSKQFSEKSCQYVSSKLADSAKNVLDI